MATNLTTLAMKDIDPEIVYSPMFVPKGTFYRIDWNVWEPGRGVAHVFHDEADYLLWKNDPGRWENEIEKKQASNNL